MKWLDRDQLAQRQAKFPLGVSVLSWALNEEECVADFLEKSQMFLVNF